MRLISPEEAAFVGDNSLRDLVLDSAAETPDVVRNNGGIILGNLNNQCVRGKKEPTHVLTSDCSCE